MSYEADTLLALPAGLAVLLGIIGLTGRWRRVWGYLLCTYAALVIAAQHYRFLSGLDPVGLGGGVYGIAVAVLWLALLIAYGLVWHPTRGEKQDESRKRGFFGRLIGAALCAVAGWGLGAMLATSGSSMLWGDTAQSFSGHPIGMTVDVVARAIEFWLPGPLPPFL
jgi:hypothetical protein